MASSVADIERAMREGKEVRFADLAKVCDHHFGKCRISGSHHIFRTPWSGDPRINIQSDGNRAKPYQVRQVLKAIDKIRAQDAAAKTKK